MDKLLIYLRFLTLSGLSNTEGERYRFLCDDAYEYFNSAAKSEKALSDYGSAFNCAAAALACLNYTLLQSGEGAKSFKAGDLSVELGSEGADCEKIREYYLKCLAAVRNQLSDEDFSFKAV